MTDAPTIAKGLTEAQRELLRGLAAVPGLFGLARFKEASVLAGADLLDFKVFDLADKILIGKPTDLGRAVAAELEGQ